MIAGETCIHMNRTCAQLAMHWSITVIVLQLVPDGLICEQIYNRLILIPHLRIMMGVTDRGIHGHAGSAPAIEMTFDATNNFILTAAFSIDRVHVLIAKEVHV